jgi:hypothetical protein
MALDRCIQGLVINGLCLEQDTPEGSSTSSILQTGELADTAGEGIMDPVVNKARSRTAECRQEALHCHLQFLFFSLQA